MHRKSTGHPEQSEARRGNLPGRFGWKPTAALGLLSLSALLLAGSSQTARSDELPDKYDSYNEYVSAHVYRAEIVWTVVQINGEFPSDRDAKFKAPADSVYQRPPVISTVGDVRLNNVIWGTNVNWGANINNLNVIWGPKISRFNVIWGNNTLWSANVIWDTRIGGVDLSATAICGDDQ